MSGVVQMNDRACELGCECVCVCVCRVASKQAVAFGRAEATARYYVKLRFEIKYFS
jgi:hypothetical protein